jgi:cystathionine beta-lyase/cystathionine gamma-synthase
MERATRCVHGAESRPGEYGAVSVPIYQTATFTHPGAGQSTGFDYSRSANPTRAALEHAVARLELARFCVATSTGMGAITAFLSQFKPGDHFVVSEDLYGVTRRMFAEIFNRYGYTYTALDTADTDGVARAIRSNTAAIFVETPSNPTMSVTDLAAVAQIAHSNGALFAVDNTFLTPHLQNPLELGADVVLHSGTKYLAGHNDCMSGFAVTNSAEQDEIMRWYAKSFGLGAPPFESWLTLRGIKTLALRVEQAERSAATLANWLQTLPEVAHVLYPGLPQHPQFDLSKRQARGFGAMIAIQLHDPAIAKRTLERVRIWLYAESLGGVESLITCPVYVTHTDIPLAEREARGITESFLRLSVGIEDVADLQADLRQAMDS